MLHSVSSPAELLTLPAARGLEAQELMAKAGGTGAALAVLGLQESSGFVCHIQQELWFLHWQSCVAPWGLKVLTLVQWAALFQMLNSP